MHPTSYDDLDPSDLNAFWLLSTHPGPDFTGPAAAALLDTDPADAGRLIAVLAGAGLLALASPGRWHLAAEASQHTPGPEGIPGERAAATARIIEYYLRASAAADLLINPGRLRIAAAFALPSRDQPAHVSPAAALAWCDSERASLLHAQQAAADNERHDLSWQFADTLWGWLSHRHTYPEWESVCETAIESAHTCGDARGEVTAAVRLASCQLAQGDTPAAATIATQAIHTAWASGDRAGEGSAREHAALCALAGGDYHGAIEHATRGLACWQHITPHRRAQALLERLLGRAYAGLGDYQQATAHLGTALAIFTELGERYPTARTQYWIAATRLASSPGGQHAAEVIALLEQARPLLRAEDHPLSLADLLTTLADAHNRAGDTSQARACLQEATALLEQLSLPTGHPARTRTTAVAS
jgi:tetratricopeptide (TPR) repeat protein